MEIDQPMNLCINITRDTDYEVVRTWRARGVGRAAGWKRSMVEKGNLRNTFNSKDKK